jgi:hypothetical protein
VQLKDEARIEYQQPTSHIRNKIRRTQRVDVLKRKKKRHQRKERDKNKKLREKLGDEAPAPSIPHTLENTRIKGETTVQPDDHEVLEDEACDSLGQCFSSGDLPKTLITTSPNPPKVWMKLAERTWQKREGGGCMCIRTCGCVFAGVSTREEEE